MKAVITVTGKDTVGIIADVATVCAHHQANILDITQSVLGEYFAMIMLADIDSLNVGFSDFVDTLERLGEGGMVALDEERKAAMVSNLLVVLCGNHDAQPVVNSGSLY